MHGVWQPPPHRADGRKVMIEVAPPESQFHSGEAAFKERFCLVGSRFRGHPTKPVTIIGRDRVITEKGRQRHPRRFCERIPNCRIHRRRRHGQRTGHAWKPEIARDCPRQIKRNERLTCQLFAELSYDRN